MNDMKYLILLLATMVCSTVWADELTENLKFGHPTKAEMELQTYAPEPDAEALVLCDLRKEYYTYPDGDFVKVVEHKVRIKVLKPEGTERANVSCLYRDSKKDNTIKESVSNISATAYNLEDGKVVATKMKSNLVFHERINDDLMLVKFSVPQVKVGTVIEYTYTERSNNGFSIDDWFAQGDIPVLYTRFTVDIPECFVFAAESTGSIPLETSNDLGSIVIVDGHASATLRTLNSSFVARNVPSLRDDDAVWCIDDYRSKVTFEFKRTEHPFPYKSYTSTWEEINALLMKDADFGGRISGSAPLKDELSALQLDTLATVDERVAAIYGMLTSRVEWNGELHLYSTKRAATVLKDGTGSNADINFLLISLLREAGIEAWPVAVRKRQNGHLPMTHPSLKKLDTFVVAFRRGDTETGEPDWGLVDGGSASGYVDVLLPQLMTDRGLLITKNGPSWIDLSARCAGREVTRIMAEVRPDGSIAGTRTNYYFQQYARLFKESIKDRSAAEIVEKKAESLEATVSDYVVDGDAATFAPNASETYAFEKAASGGLFPSSGDVLYVNPFVFSLWDTNPYSSEHRAVPVERVMKTAEDYIVTLALPEGFEVEELPATLNVKNHDGSIACKVIFTQDEGNINVSYRYQATRLIFLPEEYEQLRQIYDLICSKTAEMIAIKKKM